MLCVLRGGSMRPFLRPGAVLVVVPARLDDLRPGAVVVFRSSIPGQHLIAHRVVSVKHFRGRIAVRTRGDSVAVPDPPLSPERLVGRVTAVWQNGRLRWHAVRPGWAVLGAVMAWRWVRRSAAIGRRLRNVGSWLMSTVYAGKKGVVFRREGDEGLLFDPESGEVKLLNETGATVWEMLAAGTEREAVVERLMAEFEGADRATIERDVEKFVAAMRSAGLLACE